MTPVATRAAIITLLVLGGISSLGIVATYFSDQLTTTAWFWSAWPSFRSPPAPQPSPPPRQEACVPAGCSGQLCLPASQAAKTVTTCEYRPEYACYRWSRCERQATGACGWTETPELRSCLAQPQPTVVPFKRWKLF